MNLDGANNGVGCRAMSQAQFSSEPREKTSVGLRNPICPAKGQRTEVITTPTFPRLSSYDARSDTDLASDVVAQQNEKYCIPKVIQRPVLSPKCSISMKHPGKRPHHQKARTLETFPKSHTQIGIRRRTVPTKFAPLDQQCPSITRSRSHTTEWSEQCWW